MGDVIDTGATSTVVGSQQAQAYCRFMRVAFKLTPSETQICFGNGKQQSMGRITLRLPHPTQTAFFEMTADLVDGKLPLLLGMDFMDHYAFHPVTVVNELQSELHGARYTIVRHAGHLWLRWPTATNVLFTRAELKKLHGQFYHPSSDKLLAVLKRAAPNDCTPQTRHLLEDVTRACGVCTRFKPRPASFQVSIPEEKIVFNHCLGLDLFFIEGKPILHVVDIETGFGNAAFVDDQSVESVWRAFVDCWVSLYTGYPEKMRVDQGSQFQSLRWQARAQEAGIILESTGVERHNSNALVERYHAPLRRVYRKLRLQFPKLSPSSALRIAVKGVNDTAGPNGLTPSLLVFGSHPRLPVTHQTHPDQATRLLALAAARQEMATLVAQMRVRHALHSRTPTAAKFTFNIGEEVHVFREADRRFHGPYRVLDIDGKLLHVLVKGRRVPFSVTQCYPHYLFGNIQASPDDSPLVAAPQ